MLTSRAAVTRALADLTDAAPVIIACSGGPDSLALAGVASHVARQRGHRTLAVVVDHDLQADSARVAQWAADTCMALGVDDAVVRRVRVGTDGGPEAAARTARYSVLEEVAADRGAAAVLLGHTRDDQAETVLLRLARGSGARSLSGMREANGLWRRPFLSLARVDVQSVARELLAPLGEVPWTDPHNADPSFARVRVRSLLDDLSAAVGPGAALGLARSADLLRDDADALDAWAQREAARLVLVDGDLECASCDELAGLPRAVRTRVLRTMCLAAGALADQLTAEHIWRIDEFVTDWRGQGEASLPCGVVVTRAYGRLCVRSARADQGTPTQME